MLLLLLAPSAARHVQRGRGWGVTVAAVIGGFGSAAGALGATVRSPIVDAIVAHSCQGLRVKGGESAFGVGCAAPGGWADGVAYGNGSEHGTGMEQYE